MGRSEARAAFEPRRHAAVTRAGTVVRRARVAVLASDTDPMARMRPRTPKTIRCDRMPASRLPLIAVLPQIQRRHIACPFEAKARAVREPRDKRHLQSKAVTADPCSRC